MRWISSFIIRKHDGTGYPQKLKGEEIPIGARILRLVDSFDAMISNRPYKKSFTVLEAMNDLKKYRGIYYDGSVLDAFEEYILETGILLDTINYSS